MRTTSVILICVALAIGSAAYALTGPENTALVDGVKANTQRTVQDAQIELGKPVSFTSKTTTNIVARDIRVARIERAIKQTIADEGLTIRQAVGLGLVIGKITGGTSVTNIRTRRIAGPAIWQDIGLSRKPTDAEVRSAMKQAGE